MTVHVGIDASAPSRAALAWAARYAADFGMALAIEHVVEQSSSPDDSEERQTQLARAERLVHDARDQVLTEFDGLEVDAHVLVGELAQALADECAPHDLRVIGTHKTGYLRGRALGARGLAIVATAGSTVAIIPADHRSTRSGVVIAVTSPLSTAEIETGAAVAIARHQPILLVSASSSPGEATDRGELSDALRLVTRSAPRASVRSQTTQRQLADALLDASGAAQLLVLPEPGGDTGSFASPLILDVLLNINSPVLVVRGQAGTFAPVRDAPLPHSVEL